MSTMELERKIIKLQEWESLAEDTKAEAEVLKDEIKTEMLKEETEEMEVGRFIIRWTSVLSSRFDTTGFKRDHSDVYQQYAKQPISIRFSIS